MEPITVRTFVSSTSLDLQPERAAVEVLLQRFRETKFIGMEHFGSRDETTRQASLAEVDRSDLYIGIIGGRYGSGITEAEYDRARVKKLPCLLYFKQDTAVPPESRDPEPRNLERLKRFKAKLRDSARGHTVIEFSGPQELASRLASDLHNWLFDRYLSPALQDAGRGNLRSEQVTALNGDLRHFAAINRDSLAQAAKEKRRLDEWRRLTSSAFYQLTYVVPKALERYPNTARDRERIVRGNLRDLSRQLKLSDGAHEVLRELATNYRLLAAILMEQSKLGEAFVAFKRSAAACASLVELQPGNALYHRDRAVSHLNAGLILEQQGDPAMAREEYRVSLESARRAAELDPQWSELKRDAASRVKRLKAR